MSTVLYKLSSCLTGTHFILMLLSIGNAYVSLSLSLALRFCPIFLFMFHLPHSLDSSLSMIYANKYFVHFALYSKNISKIEYNRIDFLNRP